MTDFKESVEETMGRNLKIVLIVSMLVVTTFFCFLPKILLYYASKKEATEMDRHQFRKLRRRRRLHKVLISLTNCFASGVFLGVCLLDVLPEVEENFEKFFDAFPEVNRTFPTPQFCVVLGFLILITVEQLANLCKGEGHSFHGHHHPGGEESLFSSTASTIPPNRLDYEAIINHHDDRHHHHAHESVRLPNEEAENEVLVSSDDRETYGAIEEAAVRDCQVENDLEEEIAEAENTAEDLREEEIERREVQNDPAAHSQMRYVMLAVALSIHSVFEGLALGLMDKLSSVVQLFTAIAIHKCIVAFSFGVNMAQSDLGKCTQTITMLIFCLASPIGTLAGIGIEMVNFDEGIAGAVIGSLQGLACGSFLYIVFFELLPHEFFTRKRRPSPLLKVLGLTLGIVLMSSIMMLSPV